MFHGTRIYFLVRPLDFALLHFWTFWILDFELLSGGIESSCPKRTNQKKQNVQKDKKEKTKKRKNKEKTLYLARLSTPQYSRAAVRFHRFISVCAGLGQLLLRAAAAVCAAAAAVCAVCAAAVCACLYCCICCCRLRCCRGNP